MNLEIKDRNALVGGASSGLGFACAKALVKEGVNVVIVARTPDRLSRAKDELDQLRGGKVQAVAADLATEEGREAALNACAAFDIVITNAGGPPSGDFRQWDRSDWINAIDTNMLAPIALIKATLDGMMGRGFGRIINITSSAVKEPIATLGLSNGARSGLTGFVAGLARTTVARGVTINNILPGGFETDRLAANFTVIAKKQGVTLEQALAARLAHHPARRFGRPDELGSLCAYLCSVHAAFINGQNILIDGGSYPGTL